MIRQAWIRHEGGMQRYKQAKLNTCFLFMCMRVCLSVSAPHAWKVRKGIRSSGTGAINGRVLPRGCRLPSYKDTSHWYALVQYDLSLTNVPTKFLFLNWVMCWAAVWFSVECWPSIYRSQIPSPASHTTKWADVEVTC